jgi:Heparinase II/III-like protein
MRSVLVFSAALLALGCHRGERFPDNGGDLPASAAPLPTGPQGTLPLTSDVKAGTHPRILLTPDRLTGLEAMSRVNHPSWTVLRQNCDEGLGKKISSGHMGEDWANMALDQALCGRILKREDYTKSAVQYLTALFDDQTEVGDKKGGDKSEERDDGYAIRNVGFLASIAYDWLYDSLDDAQRKHACSRLRTYVFWYKKGGYRPTEPWSNHFMGYFGAAGMGGVACDGDEATKESGAEMRKHAREVWNTIIVPGYRARLVGGDYPEGWQYARLIGAVLGIYADAEGRSGAGGPAKLVTDLPWLRESIAFQNHALLPDTIHTYDNADWSHKPATPFPQQFYGVAMALPKDDPVARQAVWLGRLAKRPGEPVWNWLKALGDEPGRVSEDPRKGEASYLAKGTGTMFARSDWTDRAVWLSLTSSAFFGDHQHLDQGHFEIARGGDMIVIDPGDYDSYSSTSHNVILVDDKKENNRWNPNQQIYSKLAHVARYEDAGGVAYALAEYGDAYDPDDYPQYHRTHSVARAEREIVFSRTPTLAMKTPGSARVVIYDRFTLTKGTYGTTWAGHAGVTPIVTGPVIKIPVGRSAATITTVLPEGATAKLLKEPTVQTDTIFMKNDPAAGIDATRIEIASPRGKTERRFLHAIVVGAAADTPPAAVKLEGEGVDGVLVESEAYLFASAAPQKVAAAVSYSAPAQATRHVLVGLAPAGKYTATAELTGGACKISVVPGGTFTASAAGVLVLNVSACAVK